MGDPVFAHFCVTTKLLINQWTLFWWNSFKVATTPKTNPQMAITPIFSKFWPNYNSVSCAKSLDMNGCRQYAQLQGMLDLLSLDVNLPIHSSTQAKACLCPRRRTSRITWAQKKNLTEETKQKVVKSQWKTWRRREFKVTGCESLTDGEENVWKHFQRLNVSVFL